jgi:hypothetical protein
MIEMDQAQAQLYQLSSSEQTLFHHEAEALDLIAKIIAKEDDDTHSQDNDNCHSDAIIASERARRRLGALEKFRRLMDKYLECPTLIDPHLESVVIHSQLTATAQTLIQDLFFRQTTTSTDQATNSSPLSKGAVDEESSSRIACSLSAMYAMCKVCGRKKIQQCLPHDVHDVEPVLHALRKQQKYDQQSQFDMDGCGSNGNEDLKIKMPPLWESTYVLLLWMEMLSFVPFNLTTIDSNSSCATTVLEETTICTIPIPQQNQTQTLVESILQTAQSHLSDAGPTREAAANCLASYLIRFDLSSDELSAFIASSRETLLRVMDDADETIITHRSIDITFRIMGILQALAAIFKLAPNRSNLVSHIETLWEPLLRLSTQSMCKNNTVIRKLVVKLFARVGCANLPPQIAAWRYQRGGRRNLMDNLKQSQLKSQAALSTSEAAAATATSSNHKRAASATKENNSEEKKDVNVNDDEWILVPDSTLNQLEDVIDQLLHGLRDAATIVRWSAAKGIGRVTERLPALCAEDILDSVLELCSDSNRNQDSSWHGACLALAELARRGLLLPKRLSEVVPRIQQAMQYDVRRGQHSVGSHVRDAACYVCWAFARAYDPAVLAQQYSSSTCTSTSTISNNSNSNISTSRSSMDDLSVTMVIGSLFDREINGRRAASAAFQEWVGRQGAQNIKHGIDILTVADYFTLGNRVDAFTKIAPLVARYEAYGVPIVTHLCEAKLIHWDPEIRKLSSKALYALAEIKIQTLQHLFVSVVLDTIIARCLSKDLYERHGSVLGVAEIVLALSSDASKNNAVANSILRDDPKSAALTLQITNIIPAIEKQRLYRGRGGEIMRSAAMRLLECIALAKLPLPVKQQVQYLDSVDASLKHPKEDIQLASADALQALLEHYFPVGEKGPSERLQKRVVDLYVSTVLTSDNAAATRGFAMGLGRLPAKLLAPNRSVLQKVVHCLCTVSHPCRKVGDEPDAETRRNAITALGQVCQTVGVYDSHTHDASNTKLVSYPCVGLQREDISAIFQCLLKATEDYGVDRRGDVGSWVRCEAMKCLKDLVLLTVAASSAFPSVYISGGSTAKHQSSQAASASVPSFTERSQYFIEDSVRQVGQSLIERRPFQPETVRTDIIVFDEHICMLVLSAMLKQLAEKIDAVRLVAGSCIEALLLSRVPYVAFVPQRNQLLEAFQLDGVFDEEQNNHLDCSNQETATIPVNNYSSPAVAYPIVMRAAIVQVFFEPIIAGMVVSVGGLTESTVKEAYASLLAMVRAAEISKSLSVISRLGAGKCRTIW